MLSELVFIVPADSSRDDLSQLRANQDRLKNPGLLEGLVGLWLPPPGGDYLEMKKVKHGNVS